MNADASKPAPDGASQRLMSLDALRGFDMFWILGADILMRTVGTMAASGRTSLPSTEPSRPPR